MKVWGDFDQQGLDKAYDARNSVADFDRKMRQRVELSRMARERLQGILNVPFGPALEETLDVFPAKGGGPAPIHVFLHGGFWRALTKDEHSYIAPLLVASGATVVVVNYSLAPSVSLDVIVRQCAAAVVWCHRNANAIGGDPERIFVSGSSAGGHLTGMMAVTDWPGLYGLPRDVVKGGVALSGFYDLRPIRRTYAQAWARLDDLSEVSLSPTLQVPKNGCPLVVGFGETEVTAEFRKQSTDFAAAWKAAGNPCQVIPVKDTDHFSILLEYLKPDSPLGRAILAQMGLEPATGAVLSAPDALTI